MNKPMPEKDLEWYGKIPYEHTVEEKTADGATLIVRVYDIPAILAEQKRRVVEEAIKTIESLRDDPDYGDTWQLDDLLGHVSALLPNKDV